MVKTPISEPDPYFWVNHLLIVKTILMHACLVSHMLRRVPMHVCLVSLMLRKTSHSHACLLCQSHDYEYSLLLFVCLVKPNAQIKPFHACLSCQSHAQTCYFKHVWLVSPMLRQALHAILPCQPQYLRKPLSHTFIVSLMFRQATSCIFALLVTCLGKHPFLKVLISRIQAKSYNSALANHHLLVICHTIWFRYTTLWVQTTQSWSKQHFHHFTNIF